MESGSKVSISLPLPNIGVDHDKMDAVMQDLKADRIDFELKGITPYPVSESWVEISLNIASFLGAAGAGHYAAKLFAMLDAAAKSGVTKFNAILKRGSKESHCDLPRDDRAEAIKILTKALEELKNEE